MALSSVTYSGNGSTTSFAIPFPYLFQSDVSATVNGVTAAFTWTNPALIHFATAPINGSAVFIVRKTNITTLDVVFTDGSTVQASDINTAELQSLYLAQEANDGVSVAIAAAATATAATGAANAAAAAANAAVAGLVPFTGDSGAGGVQGLVPAPPAGSSSAGKFLAAGGSWALPPTATSSFVGVNVITSGADRTGATDSWAVFQAVLASIGTTGGVVIIPPGRYMISSQLAFSIAAGKVVTIQGYGADLSVLFTPTGNILSVTLHDETSGINIKDMSLTTQAATVGTAISVTQTVSAAAPNGVVNNFTNLTIRGDDGYGGVKIFSTGITILGGVSYCNFTNIFVPGSSLFTGNGVVLQGDVTNSRFGVEYNFLNCAFNYINEPIVYGSFIQGVSVVSCNFTGTSNGIIQPVGTTGAAFQLAVVNSQFNCRASAIQVNVGIGGVFISNSLFSAGANSWFGIVGALSEATITGNTFLNTAFTGTIGVVATPTSTVVNIVGNTFLSLSTGVLLQAGVTNAQTQSNVYKGSTTANTNPPTSSGTVLIGGGSA